MELCTIELQSRSLSLYLRSVCGNLHFILQKTVQPTHVRTQSSPLLHQLVHPSVTARADLGLVASEDRNAEDVFRVAQHAAP